VNVRAQILSFLRDPAAFARAAGDPQIWRAGLEDFAEPSLERHGEYALRPAQRAAWAGMAEARAGLVLGPPGTGKTHLLSWLILGYVHARRAAGMPARVHVTAFTRNAIGNLLDAVAERASVHWPGNVDLHFFGSAPPAGLSPLVHHRPLLHGRHGAEAIADLRADAVVTGSSIWSLYRLLQRGDTGGDDPFTAELFDLVCIDEASQMVLSHGLMAIAGLRPGGRIVVAGDDRQLPPIRAGREVTLGQRQLGGSLYDFLASGGVPEFALDETFRLNAPLAVFPERKFYPGRYRSVVETNRLELVEDWKAGLEPWEAAALDPDWPVAVLLHDGPPAATTNGFEAGLAVRLAQRLAERIAGGRTGDVLSSDFWTQRLAVVSPHRAQNAMIRNALPQTLRSGAFVETVDRIQGKERDAVILSYCVGDAEFALAEADFIFAPERLNVAVTRARTKLVVLVSRRLLDAVPADQDQMDKAEMLREFVFSAEPKGEVHLRDPAGGRVRVQVRLSGFEGPPEFEELGSEATAPAEAPVAEPGELFDAVQSVALKSPYGTAATWDLQRHLATRDDLLPGLAELHARGRVSLEPRRNRKGEVFWVARPLDPPRIVFPADSDSVRRYGEEAITQSRSGRLAPFYDKVRGCFAWMDGTGTDVLKPVFDALRQEGLLSYGTARDRLTVDWVEQEQEPADPQPEIEPDLSDDDFTILNTLEDLEAGRINFGVFEGWTSAAGLADQTRFSRDVVTAALARLSAAGWIMLAADGRVRSRMAELAREIRYVKQRFSRGDADRRPYLVRGLKIELRNRDKPERLDPVKETFARVAEQLPEPHAGVLHGLSGALEKLWGRDSCMAGFQARSLETLSRAWKGDGDDAFVVAADTGSGKTEAAALPLIAGAAADRLAGITGVRAILAYPRIRLATNQAQRLAYYLAGLAREPGMPLVTLGLQMGQVPESFETLNERERQAGWTPLGSGELAFPFFACPSPSCAGDLLLAPGAGTLGADRLACMRCDWSYAGWVGSKAGLRNEPPALFLPTTDSLHQWLHDTRYGRLFGDDATHAAPRAMLADEIHLYSHVHGAQVGYTLRRLAARAESNDDGARPMLAIGMSATLGDPAAAWGRLVGREQVRLLGPTRDERAANPRGRECFYFVQPEVESRGQDIAGASTTIQSLMCLTHGMRRRTGRQGGFRALVFLDSIDRIRRLHAAYDDAETVKKLAAYRTRRYPNDPVTNSPRDGCCGEPHGCDAFRDGECWFFAATDPAQRGARGPRTPGSPLRVAEQPVFSGATGRIEALIKDSDVVFATSSLEVGYDDPDITLVYQHYAPRNLASFVQRKGRGGRGADDRPITAATLSIYSSRDSWWFRRPRDMIEPAGFDTPLNPDNHFVRRGQLLAAMLDAFARWQRRAAGGFDPASPPAGALEEAEKLAARIFGPDPWREFGEAGPAGLWRRAHERAGGGRVSYLSEVRAAIDWIPDLLFDTINVPSLHVQAGSADARAEDIALAMAAAAPGNATMRYDGVEVHWRPPVDGKGPWLASADYEDGETRLPFGDDPEEWLSRLPDDARPLLADLSPRYFRPKRMTLELLGRRYGTGWQSGWIVPEADRPHVERIQPDADASRSVRYDSRGSLRGFPVIKASAGRARPLDASGLVPWVDGVDHFMGDGLGGKETGLALARVYWGADAELLLERPSAETAVFSQIFTAPDDGRPLLHGYHVQTEGVRFRLDAAHLDTFVAAEAARLKEDAPAQRWHAGQMLRFIVESGAQAQGLNAYEARRGAELMVSAAGEPELRNRLLRLLNFWSAQDLADLFEDTRARMLSQHPLLSRARVKRVAESLSGQRFQEMFRQAVQATSDATSFSRYLKSVVLHSLAVRLKESFVQVGRGDERQVAMHVQLPTQFRDAGDPVITLCEVGAFGDGTARSFADRFEASVRHWSDGFIGDCPNARDDAALLRFFEQERHHEAWRQLDPNDPAALAALATPLGLPTESPVPSAILRILFGAEQVGIERLDLYDLACSIRAADKQLSARLGRMPSAWELTSVVVGDARQNGESSPGRLLAAYAALEDAAFEESLSPEGRLADQVFRLHARLCVDGCRACTHQPSDMMTDSMVEASTSRSLLSRFICAG
jgi:hypothetical protein